ncbi:TetR/AcrR family transcriptional regulator [Mucilaginibacter sp.]|jgi:TetR/AcrR family transcriptional repressor of nem operon|uniref:TetR/AcrR family transcriptional regulator n=1 Tax=Mucilaginibacter sp. TaxID=1882438 RepID=UPI00356B16C6
MNNTQEQIVKLGRDFIQTFGYNSFSFKQIADVLNIKNAAIHHYYPTKEDLGLAVIEKDKSDFMALAKALQVASPTEKTNAIINLYRNYYNDGKKLCMISTCGSIFEQLSPKMQSATREHLDTIYSWLEEVFQKGADTKEFHFSETAKEMSTRWIANLPGALITGRIRGREYLENSLNQLSASLNTK